VVRPPLLERRILGNISLNASWTMMLQWGGAPSIAVRWFSICRNKLVLHLPQWVGTRSASMNWCSSCCNELVLHLPQEFENCRLRTEGSWNFSSITRQMFLLNQA
jgi:hypothetical protein